MCSRLSLGEKTKSVMKRVGFYSGSFDPVTLGHLDIIARSAKLFDTLVIGIGVHHGKTPFFPEAERREMLYQETRPIVLETGTLIDIVSFDGLVVDAARKAEAHAIIRGLRDGGDFRYEAQMAGMNACMAEDIETVFFISSPKHKHIASKFVRQIASMGGDISPFVPEAVMKKFKQKHQ